MIRNTVLVIIAVGVSLNANASNKSSYRDHMNKVGQCVGLVDTEWGTYSKNSDGELTSNGDGLIHELDRANQKTIKLEAGAEVAARIAELESELKNIGTFQENIRIEEIEELIANEVDPYKTYPNEMAELNNLEREKSFIEAERKALEGDISETKRDRDYLLWELNDGLKGQEKHVQSIKLLNESISNTALKFEKCVGLSDGSTPTLSIEQLKEYKVMWESFQSESHARSKIGENDLSSGNEAS